MPEEPAAKRSTVALSTKLEEDFVSPLTAVRGALEILRDYPDLDPQQRARFVRSALEGCARLEEGIDHLGATVYAAGQRDPDDLSPQPDASPGYADRIRFLDEHETVELDLSGLEISSSRVVNELYDALEAKLETAGQRSWYFLVNFQDCHVWPEAWVAFAHRGKRVSVRFSRGTVRFVERADPAQVAGTFSSRDGALAHIDGLRREAGASQAGRR